MTVDYEPSELLWSADPFEDAISSAREQYGAVAVATGSLGRIYILSGWGAYSIARMNDPQGNGRVTFGGTNGPGMWRFNSPSDIWIDANDRILVADTSNGRIVRIDDMTGGGWTELGGFAGPTGVCTDAQGRIYVADAGANEVIRVDNMAGANRVSDYRAGCRAVRVGPSGKVYVVRGTSVDTTVDVLTGFPPSDSTQRGVPFASRIAIDSQERMLITLWDGRLMRLDGPNDTSPEYVQVTTNPGLSGIAIYDPDSMLPVWQE